MTIEQRAEQYANEKTGYSRDSRWREAFKDYAQGAAAQKALDDEEYRKDMTYVVAKKEEWIDKACEWLMRHTNDKWVYNGKEYEGPMTTAFRKFMEYGND